LCWEGKGKSKGKGQKAKINSGWRRVFIKFATEFHNEVTRMLNAHEEWRRGQGPTNGREKRNPRG